MPRLHKITVLALVVPLLLAGCSVSQPPEPTASDPAAPQTSEPSTSPTPDTAVERATGTLIAGNGFTVNAPEGWVEFVVEGGAGTTFRKEGRADHFNVFRSNATGISLEQAELTAEQSWKDSGRTDVKVHDHFTIGGNEVAHLSAYYDVDDVKFFTEKFFVSDGDGDGGDAFEGNGDAIAIATFSFSIDVSEADRLALSKSVLATWTWS